MTEMAVMTKGETMTTIARSRWGWLLALIVAVQSAPLWAEAVGEPAKHDRTGASQAQIPWVSGGVGYEARDEIRNAAAAYSVHVIFSNRQGSYLADIPFTVSKLSGRELASGVSEGPLLYLNLPPGSYQIAVLLDGIWHKKRILAGSNRNPAKVSFVGNGK
jgi:hypothetical protein